MNLDQYLSDRITDFETVAREKHGHNTRIVHHEGRDGYIPLRENWKIVYFGPAGAVNWTPQHGVVIGHTKTETARWLLLHHRQWHRH